MHHYTYLITFPDGMKYVGVHSTVIRPDLDTRYLGSGRGLPERTPDSCVKTVLGTYPTRQEALTAEVDYILTHNCCESDNYYNIRKSSYDLHGKTKETVPGIARAAEKLRGRVNGPMASHAANHLTGERRTPAQKDGAMRMRKAITGTKNPDKAHKGIDNSGFAPWYYITPEGVYTEIHTTTKQDFAVSIGVPVSQIYNRFLPYIQHQEGKQGKWKHWTFGNLPKPMSTGTD